MKHDNKQTEIKDKDTHGQENKSGKKDTKLGGNLDKRKSKSAGGAVG